MEKDIIIRILKGEHISIPERIELGILNHPPLKCEELVKILSETISSQDWFPFPLSTLKENEAVYEGGIIERIAEDKFVYHWQRPYADNPFMIAERADKIFNTAEKVARHYLKYDLNLPGDLDGFRVK